MKKAMALPTIIIFVLVFMVLVIVGSIFFSSEGLFQKVTEGIYSVLDYLPGIEIDTPTNQIETEEGVVEGFDGLVKLMLDNKDKEGPCFLRYDEPPELGEGKLEFTFFNNMMVARLYQGTQIVKFQEIADLKPCVVAGMIGINPDFPISDGADFEIPKNFYRNYCEGIPLRAVYPDFAEVNGVYLLENDNIQHTMYGDEKYDLEDGGFLYKPDKNHICFFPTRDGNTGCDGDSIYSMDDDCFEDEDECLLMQFELGKLPMCS